jgi:Terminase large subunit, T4likevirus-type, N-terminal
METKTLNLNWPWRRMHDAFFDPTPFGTIRSCRRSFKTMGATRYIIEKLLDTPNSTGIWVDTINKNIDRYYERYFKPLVGEVTAWNYQKKTLEFVNGSYLDFGSAESPENMEGFEYDYFILNEAGIILRKDALWDNTLRPMFKNSKGGRVLGTPKGKNKFHKLCHLGGWAHYHFNIHDCPFYTQDEIKKIKSETPEEVWKQEYLAEFIDGAGSVFRSIRQCIDDTQYDEPKKNIEYVMSVDLAKHTDFTVIYIAERKNKKVIYQERFNQIDWGLQKQRIVSLYRRWNIKQMIIDSTGVGDSIYDDLAGVALSIQSFKFTSTSKNQLIQNLSVSMDNKDITFAAFPELISELEIFGYEVSQMGNIRYNAPSGYHDDCVISLALINQLLNGVQEFNPYEAWLSET